MWKLWTKQVFMANFISKYKSRGVFANSRDMSVKVSPQLGMRVSYWKSEVSFAIVPSRRGVRVIHDRIDLILQPRLDSP
jgi:hypothetical protein